MKISEDNPGARDGGEIFTFFDNGSVPGGNELAKWDPSAPSPHAHVPRCLTLVHLSPTQLSLRSLSDVTALPSPEIILSHVDTRLDSDCQQRPFKYLM